MLKLDLNIEAYKKSGFKILVIFFIAAVSYFAGDFTLTMLENRNPADEGLIALRVAYTALATLVAFGSLIIISLIGYKVGKILSFQSKQHFHITDGVLHVKSPLDYQETKIPLSTVNEINLTKEDGLLSVIVGYYPKSYLSKFKKPKATKTRLFLFASDYKAFTKYFSTYHESIPVYTHQSAEPVSTPKTV